MEKIEKSTLNTEELCFDLDTNENVHEVRNRNDCVRFECHKTTICFKNFPKFIRGHAIAQYVLFVTLCLVTRLI